MNWQCVDRGDVEEDAKNDLGIFDRIEVPVIQWEKLEKEQIWECNFIMLMKERNQIQKAKYFIIPLQWNFLKRQNYIEGRSVVTWG